LSIGIAWMVIVAAEMLSGGIGIGFFVWDSWNALSLEKVFSAILVIGLVGFLLDKSFKSLQTRFTYDN
jgi:nitrate/nitrite transport system permease protein